MTKSSKKRKAKPAAYVVFISHYSEDNWVAKQMDKLIQGRGATTWLDTKDLKGGDVLVKDLARKVCRTKYLLVRQK